MVYLRYAYQKSGLPEPTKIGLQINDTESVQADVVEEFIMAFSKAKVQKDVSRRIVPDIYILAFRKRIGVLEQIKWGRQHLQQTKLGVGFFCISERTLCIVPRRQFYSWAMSTWLSGTLIEILKLNIRAKSYIRQIL